MVSRSFTTTDSGLTKNFGGNPGALLEADASSVSITSTLSSNLLIEETLLSNFVVTETVSSGLIGSLLITSSDSSSKAFLIAFFSASFSSSVLSTDSSIFLNATSEISAVNKDLISSFVSITVFDSTTSCLASLSRFFSFTETSKSSSDPSSDPSSDSSSDCISASSSFFNFGSFFTSGSFFFLVLVVTITASSGLIGSLPITSADSSNKTFLTAFFSAAFSSSVFSKDSSIFFTATSEI